MLGQRVSLKSILIKSHIFFYGRVLLLSLVLLSVMLGTSGCSTQVKTEAYYDTGKKKLEHTYRKWIWSSQEKLILKKEYHFTQHPKFEVEIKNGKYHGEAKTWWMNGRLKSRGEYKNGKKIGKWVNYFEVRGDISSRGHYRQGILHGVWEEWWPKFIRKAKGQFQNGKPGGTWHYWDRAERLIKKSTCWEDVKWGSIEEYYPSGRLKKIHSCLFGKISGQYKEYYPDSSLKLKGEYNKDSKKEGPWLGFHPNGKKSLREFYVNGLLHDSLIHWDSLGHVSKKALMDSGNGSIYRYYPDGKVKRVEQFLEGKKHGEQLSFFPFGRTKTRYIYDKNKALEYWRWHADSLSSDSVLTIHGLFKEGKRHGEWNWYSENGMLLESANYVLGKRHGKAYFYNSQNGKLFRIQNYEDGVETSATLHNF